MGELEESQRKHILQQGDSVSEARGVGCDEGIEESGSDQGMSLP